MKSISHIGSGHGKIFALLLAALGLLAVSATAADMVRYNGKPGSKVAIAGTSTIHDWTMDGQIISGFFEVPAGVEFDQSKAGLPGVEGGKLAAHVETSIPVRSLKSGHDGMDEVMQQAMNEKTFPKIQYKLTEMTLKEPHAAGTPFQFDTKGELAVNGVTNSIALPVTVESFDKTKLKVAGKIPLKMTDYKVKPPAPAIGLGMIKTGDEVTISFEWLVAQPKTQP
ncbi:MAG: YceI family protein [Verrucomicrobiota bacterium]